MAQEFSMNGRGRLIVLLVSVPVIAFAVIGGFMGNALASRQDSYQYLRIFEDVVTLILNNYVEEVDVDKVMQGAMHGLADGLDPDSAYLDAGQVKSFEKNDSAGVAQVGIELTRQYYLRVIAARDGSPAARAGLAPGDYIRAIDGQSTRDTSVYEGMRLLRGKAGTRVHLTVLRGNAARTRWNCSARTWRPCRSRAAWRPRRRGICACRSSDARPSIRSRRKWRPWASRGRRGWSSICAARRLATPNRA
jgi:C-terminal processing protease CtpA/Prc